MNTPKRINIKDYTYHLPHECIAYEPVVPKDTSKCLIYNKGEIQHTIFNQIPSYFNENMVLVLNNTKVIKARLYFTTPTGAQVELFCLYETSKGNQSAQWVCYIGNFKRWKTSTLELSYQELHLKATCVEPYEDGYIVNFEWNTSQTFFEVLEILGKMPLPPYIKRVATSLDEHLYQTCFANEEGSVAAPTASLHFTPEVLEAIQAQGTTIVYLTLHVGAGTFKPVKADELGAHHMHQELFHCSKEVIQTLIEAKAQGKKIVAVGTTVARTLESLYWLAEQAQQKTLEQWCWLEGSEASALSNLKQLQGQDVEAYTQILIAPPYNFKVVDELITNFHQPESTLLLLIASLIGDDWKKIYTTAMDHKYRFLSYGDSSWLSPKK